MNFYHNDTSRAHKDRIIRLVSDYLAEVAREKLEFKMPQLPYQNSAIKVNGITIMNFRKKCTVITPNCSLKFRDNFFRPLFSISAENK